MNISNAQINKVLEMHLHKVYAPQPKSGITASRGTDQLVLSSKAADIQMAKQTVAGLPTTRPEVVNATRQMIQTGAYQITGSDLAESMFSGAMQSTLRF